MVRGTSLLLGVISILLALPAVAADEPEPRSHSVWLAPPGDLYRVYVADPRRSQSALLIMSLPSSEIEQAGDLRFGVRLGGRFGLVRFHPPDDPTRGLQLDFEAGFFGQFDLDSSQDNIGWDGLYGLTASWRWSERLAVRLGRLHDSAHVGDEYAEDTGRTRIGYTREEWIAGGSWRLNQAWRLYTEVGWDPAPRPFQRSWRAQLGGEWVGEQRWWNGWLRPYAAADLQLWEERDWQPGGTLQLGVILPTGRGTSRFRLALEAGTGRSALGEFSFDDETWIALGWYFDL